MLYPNQLSDLVANHRILVPMPLGQVRTTGAQSSGRAGGHPLTVIPLVVRPGVLTHVGNNQRQDSFADVPPGIGIIGFGSPDGVFNGIRADIARPVAHPTVNPRVIRTSSMMQGMLIHRVEPQYPAIARSARVEGPVKITAIISREGAIEQAQVISGSPLLGRAAIDAVRQWRYKPYILNGEPVEVETQITVNFVLGR
jgi:protein TonB